MFPKDNCALVAWLASVDDPCAHFSEPENAMPRYKVITMKPVDFKRTVATLTENKHLSFFFSVYFDLPLGSLIMQ